ncbi:MAG: hypothetical protein QOG64_539, partial [Acidimicrobiaceae bacterium]|nr:hypothetical protein [Acidimicrobiaceae bacterium]
HVSRLLTRSLERLRDLTRETSA